MFDIFISNGIIITGENAYQARIGSVGIRDGKITYVGENRFTPEMAQEWIDATDKIVMPGLFNGHCHGDMTILRGLLDDLTLLEQNERMKDSCWFRKYMTDEDLYLSRQLTYLEAIKSGTTFLMENMYWSLGLSSVRAMKESGISGALAEGVRARFDVQGVYREMDYLRTFIDDARGNGLIPVLGTIAEEDFTDQTLKEITDIARSLDCLTTQHMAENLWRKKLIQNRFATTPVRYLREVGALHSRIIGSHVVCVDKEEIGILKAMGIRIVNTPVCEMKIADGIAPLPEFLKARIPVALGTDGALWNNANDLFQEMKAACLLHTVHSGIRSLSHVDALNMATIGGARVFGIDEQTGSIQEGKRADIILLETRSLHMQPLRLGRNENVASSVVFNASGADVTHSIIRGKVVMRNRVILTMDEGKLLQKVRRASESIMERHGDIR